MRKIECIIKAIQNDLLPLTRKSVAAGNHVFGGLVIDARTLETVVAGTNNRQSNPIYHGEIDTIQRFFALKDRPAPEDCIFVASHDPCSMCISAIAWSGFREIWVLFGYEDVAKDFDMPVDLMMYHDIFGAAGANPDNSFFKKYSLKDEAAKEQDSAVLAAEMEEIAAAYAALEVQDFDYPGM
ncbi:MAG: deaminase [Synergistaceae bacterium]|nr:deaminase [Synergistaceae bacterium]